MAISVAVNGAFGKMGHLACESLEQDERFRLVGRLGRSDDLKAFIQGKKPEVVVDLTRADVVYHNLSVMIEQGVRPVIGTSGLTEAQIETCTQQSEQKQLGGLIVPNFSLGVLLMIHFSKQAARFLDAVEIVESHHVQKFDAPSGTALKTASEIAKVRKNVDIDERQTQMKARGEWVNDIPIHALRLPGVLAKQSVIFGALGETLTLTHESIDRQSFMPGVLLACEKVMELHTLKYGLEQVIKGFE